MFKHFRTGLALLVLAALGFSARAWASEPGRLIQVVRQFPTSLSFTASPATAVAGSSISFHTVLSTAKANPPTGAVIFTLVPSDGIATSVSGPVPVVNDAASWSMTPPEGQDIVTASYTGDTNYAAASASTTITMSAVPGKPDFDFTMPTVTIARGKDATATISIVSTNGFNGTISFTCGALPDNMTCGFPLHSGVSVAQGDRLSATAPATIQMRIGTIAPIITTLSGAFLLFGFTGFEWRKKRSWLKALLVGSALAATVGCGVQNRFVQSGGTALGTYHIPITATSGTISHTHTLTVVVTH